MSSDWRAEDARRQIVRLCHAGLDAATLRLRVMDQVRRAVAFDAWCWPTADPATGLVTGADGRGIPPARTKRFFEIEYLEPDFNKFTELARGPARTGALSAATDGQLERSPRYREVFGPAGIGEDLRAALIVDGSCWGYLALHRDPAQPFGDVETTFVEQIAPHLAEGLRTSLLLGVIDEAPTDGAPGIVLVNDDLSIASVSNSAQPLLDDLPSKHARTAGSLPDAVLSVIAELRGLEATEAAVDRVPRARIATRSGPWLLIHATRLPTAQTSQIAVVLEPARSHELMPLVLQAYGLTRREGQIARLVLLGQPTAEISAALGISPLTVQQHLKGVFDKVGVHSKRELAARIWTQHYWPRMAARADRVGPAGS